jgi:hypothetical protein
MEEPQDVRYIRASPIEFELAPSVASDVERQAVHSIIEQVGGVAEAHMALCRRDADFPSIQVLGVVLLPEADEEYVFREILDRIRATFGPGALETIIPCGGPDDAARLALVRSLESEVYPSIRRPPMSWRTKLAAAVGVVVLLAVTYLRTLWPL